MSPQKRLESEDSMRQDCAVVVANARWSPGSLCGPPLSLRSGISHNAGGPVRAQRCRQTSLGLVAQAVESARECSDELSPGTARRSGR